MTRDSGRGVEGLSPTEALAAAVISVAIERDGPDYFTMPCGRYWCGAAGLEPDFMYRKAAGELHKDIPFKPTNQCRHAPEKRSRKPGLRRETFKCQHGIAICMF